MFGINFNISCAFIVFNYHKFCIFTDFFRPTPLKVLENHAPLRQVSSIFIKLSSVGWKIFIDPFLSGISCQPLEDCGLLLIVLTHRIIFHLFSLISASFIMRWIFDLKLRIWRSNITVSIVHEIFLIVIVSVEDAFVIEVGFWLGTFLFGVTFHESFKYYIDQRFKIIWT